MPNVKGTFGRENPQPLQLPQVTNHTRNATIGHWSFSSSFVGSMDDFLFGFERWDLGMVICGSVGFFFFFFWILSENWSNMMFLLEYE